MGKMLISDQKFQSENQKTIRKKFINKDDVSKFIFFQFSNCPDYLESQFK